MTDPNTTRSLTHSSESSFKTCPRRYQLSYVKMLRPAFNSDALRIGDAVHAGLELLKRGENVPQACDAVRTKYEDQPCPPWLTPEEYDVEYYTSSAIVRAYAVRWRDSHILRYIAVEQDFDLPIINPLSGRVNTLFRNKGKIDGIAELPDGRLAIVEHKTTSDDITIVSDYWTRLRLDAQISRYYLAAQQLGYPVQTTVYDVIRKPAIRPKNVSKADRAMATADGRYFSLPLTAICPERETPKMFGARLEADMIERPAHYFARNEVPRLDADLDEFRLDQWATSRAIAACEADGYWPRNTNACTSPYRCQFLDVCRGLRGDPEEQVPDGFRVASKLHEELSQVQGPILSA